MKKIYELHIIGDKMYNYTVEATHYHNTTSNSSSSGFYSFYDDNILIACFPIEKTIIYKISNIK